MENNMTNIAEILKDCPKGTKLYSLVHGECELVKVWTEPDERIDIIYHEVYEMSLDEYGRAFEYGECLLFPSKENRDWNTFGEPKYLEPSKSFVKNVQDTIDAVKKDNLIKKPKFKKGDFVVSDYGTIGIYEDCEIMMPALVYDGYFSLLKHACNITRLATEEEKQLLLKAIGENGYVWDAEKLELKKKELEIYPGEYYTCIKDFKHNGHDVLKVGKTYRGSDSSCHCVLGEENRLFIVGHDTKNAVEYLRFSTIDEIRSFIKEKNYPKFKPFDRVLVRDCDGAIWLPALYGFSDKETNMNYFIVGGTSWKHCIPYEGNEHLLGTTDNLK